MTNETSTEARYGVTLVRSDSEKGVPLYFEGKTLAHYLVRSQFTKQELVEHFGSKERLGRLVNSGLEVARASHNVRKVTPTRVDVYEGAENPDHLEVLPEVPGRSNVSITDTLWDQ